MARAFVIRPFGEKKDASGKKVDFELIHRELIEPALEAADIGSLTTGEIVEPGNIREDMFTLILEADLVVCDITLHNANVFYELGIRHALRKRHTVLIKGEPTSDAIPFEILTDRYQAYEIDDPAAAKDKLKEIIKSALFSEHLTDSPIFKLLPTLSEADPSNVIAVPLDYREEINRAHAARAKGWLRLISEDVRHQRFQLDGLKLVATMQWDVEDYDGARESWEIIRSTYPNDIAANLALANIYHHLYCDTKKPELLEVSEQAIDRVFGNAATSRKQRAEALMLKGQNQKTRWRLEFEDLKTIEERRTAAMNRSLIRSYEAYRDAYFEDLNYFYPGLNALKIGTILLDLAEIDAWYDGFDSDHNADSYRGNLEQEVNTLQTLISTSVETSLSRIDKGDPERLWAEISKAEVMFLTDNKRETRVISAYRDALPMDKHYAWDTTCNQLELFLNLGVNKDLASKVITEINTRFIDRDKQVVRKPVHLILFAGHRVDDPGRPEKRFPAEYANRAKALILKAVEELLDDRYETIGLASAAPGTDILAHEVCAELRINSRICLPMPADIFARLTFQNLGTWRTKFLDLQQNREVLVLSNSEELPHWLQGSGENFWQRGNRWVIQMALASDADRITLIALWDGKQEGDAPGGTAHMLKLAEDTGKVHIKRIDSTQLLKNDIET